ncbi:unnamed protein product [Amoebophrya sp. A25]|nr:unnamed protein product [Amoebophrya sp. A25]|eukprot:GSA25T00004127001.1
MKVSTIASILLSGGQLLAPAIRVRRQRVATVVLNRRRRRNPPGDGLPQPSHLNPLKTPVLDLRRESPEELQAQVWRDEMNSILALPVDTEEERNTRYDAIESFESRLRDGLDTPGNIKRKLVADLEREIGEMWRAEFTEVMKGPTDDLAEELKEIEQKLNEGTNFIPDAETKEYILKAIGEQKVRS